MRERYESALTFEAFMESAEKQREMWTSIHRRAEIPSEIATRAAGLTGQWHLLVLAEDWCGDAFNTVPVIARLAEASSGMDLRILRRDENLDLMDAHLTGTSRSIPVVMALDGEYAERGWWGPRPTELQSWFESEGRAMAPADRYREIRRFYARDRGRTTLSEIMGLLEAHDAGYARDGEA